MLMRREVGSAIPRSIRSIVGLKKLSRLVALLCALGSIHWISAQQPGSKKVLPRSEVAQARASIAAGNFTGAIQILSNHVTAHPTEASARLLLAEAYMSAGEVAQAEEQYQAILQFAPDNSAALTGLGEIYERAGNLDKAEAMLADAARASHGDAKMQTEWAAVLARLHRYSEASRALRGVSVPDSPEDRIAFFRLKASVAAGLGDAGMAATAMETALALSPNQVGLQMATAAAEIEARHWRRAAALAGSASARTHDPGSRLMLLEAQLGAGEDIRPTLDAFRNVSLPAQQEVILRQRLAELLIAHGRFAESADELKRAVEIEPGRTDLTFNLALAEFKAGRLDEALATAELLRKTSDSAEVEELSGDMEEARGDNLGAVHSYQAAVTLAPNEERYRLSLALELIRHKSFEPARVVLEQAQESDPKSWRVQIALGMVEYFAGSAENASKILLRAADLAADPAPALKYLGEVQMDEAGTPDSAALTRLCQYGDAHSGAGTIQFYCAALVFRKGYLSHDRSHADEIFRRLEAAARSLPREASPHCQLGKAYRWIERWQDALRESETCARMDPASADAHYRLAQIYQRLGQQKRSQQEMELYQTASARVADENARRDETIKTFLYSIRNDKSNTK
jgi:tetratricopeptide (TPR) repeat protein